MASALEWRLLVKLADSSPELHRGRRSVVGVAIVPSIFSSAAGQRIVFRELHPRPEPLVLGLAYHRRRLGPATRQFVKSVSALAT